MTANRHADLTKLAYTNELEKHLITKVYSNVNKLSSILSDLGGDDGSRLRAFLNTPDPNDCLPLYYAIKSDCLNAVRILIAAGSPLDRTTGSGDPAAHLACLLGVSLQLIDFLVSVESGDPRALYKTDQEGWTVLHCASNEGHLDVVKYLIEKKFMNPNIKDAKFRYTGLQLATVNNRIEVVNYYLSFLIQQPSMMAKHRHVAPPPPPPTLTPAPAPRKSPPATANPLNRSLSNILPLISATTPTSKPAADRSSLLLDRPTVISYYREQVETNNDVNKTQAFANFSIDLNSQNSDGQTVLHLACAFGRYQLVETLLKRFASHVLDINMTDFRGRTCLDLAFAWLSGINSWEDLGGKQTKQNKNSTT